MRALPVALGSLAVSFATFVGLRVIYPWAIDGYGMNVFATQADLRILRQAVLIYQKQRGSLPDTLDQLVPEFLERLPKDRWSAAYGYRRDATNPQFLLYSTGADAKDQAGAGDDIVEWEKESDCKVYGAGCLSERLTELARLTSLAMLLLSALASVGLLAEGLWHRSRHTNRAT
ncbi:type II secretion system protein GspG [Ideonella sp. DXS29W]|uniref:Type II secretion system protein GspG n=1 Tax=Ideonella lacteola TaxID=2984193 RepID=A0ABU9BYE9_9BURK